MKQLFLLTILTVAFCFTANAQTTPNDSDVVRRQLVSALERSQSEVRASRKLIDTLKESVESKENQIKAMSAKDELAQSAITGLQSEITNLRAAITAAEAALEIRKAEVAELKKQLDSTRRKLHRARAFTKYLVITVAALGALVIIK